MSFFFLFHLLPVLLLLLPLLSTFLLSSPSFLFNIMTSVLCVQGLEERQVQRLFSGNNTRFTLYSAISPRQMCAVILVVIRVNRDQSWRPEFDNVGRWNSKPWKVTRVSTRHVIGAWISVTSGGSRSLAHTSYHRRHRRMEIISFN